MHQWRKMKSAEMLITGNLMQKLSQYGKEKVRSIWIQWKAAIQTKMNRVLSVMLKKWNMEMRINMVLTQML